MGDVITLPPKQELVLICACGCQTWFIHDTRFQCAACEDFYDGNPREEYDFPIWAIPPDGMFIKLDGLKSSSVPTNILVERFKRQFTGDEQIGIIIDSKGGWNVYTTDCSIESDKELSWLKRRFDEILKDFKEKIRRVRTNRTTNKRANP